MLLIIIAGDLSSMLAVLELFFFCRRINYRVFFLHSRFEITKKIRKYIWFFVESMFHRFFGWWCFVDDVQSIFCQFAGKFSLFFLHGRFEITKKILKYIWFFVAAPSMFRRFFGWWCFVDDVQSIFCQFAAKFSCRLFV